MGRAPSGHSGKERSGMTKLDDKKRLSLHEAARLLAYGESDIDAPERCQMAEMAKQISEDDTEAAKKAKTSAALEFSAAIFWRAIMLIAEYGVLEKITIWGRENEAASHIQVPSHEIDSHGIDITGDKMEGSIGRYINLRIMAGDIYRLGLIIERDAHEKQITVGPDGISERDVAIIVAINDAYPIVAREMGKTNPGILAICNWVVAKHGEATAAPNRRTIKKFRGISADRMKQIWDKHPEKHLF
jgi:hypothetical protein